MKQYILWVVSLLILITAHYAAKPSSTSHNIFSRFSSIDNASEKKENKRVNFNTIKSNVNKVLSKVDPNEAAIVYIGHHLLVHNYRRLIFFVLKCLNKIEACDKNYKYMHLHIIANDIAQKAGIKSTIKVYILDTFTGIAATGSMLPTHPWIVVDKKWAETAPLTEFAAVIAHEIGHIQSHDMFKSLTIHSFATSLIAQVFQSPWPFFGGMFVLMLLELRQAKAAERKADLTSAKLVGSRSLVGFFKRNVRLVSDSSADTFAYVHVNLSYVCI